jgi:hypothetical protein
MSPTNKKLDKAPLNPDRRKALQKMAVAGAAATVLGFSGKWSKPVVDSVILPAHAQATNAVSEGGTTTTTTTTTTANPNQT